MWLLSMEKLDKPTGEDTEELRNILPRSQETKGFNHRKTEETLKRG